MHEWIRRWDSLICACIYTTACLVSLFLFKQEQLGLFFWAAGLLIAGNYFLKSDPGCTRQLHLTRSDLVVIILLIALFAPFYLISPKTGIGYFHTEEGVMLNAARSLSTSFDILGLYKSWWDFPNLEFWLPAQIAKLLFGSISIITLRLVEGLCGLFFVSASYVFLRLALPLNAALSGAIMLGSQQTVLGYSRMGKWEIHIIATEVAALAVLYLSLKTSSKFFAYLGGVISGFSFLESPPAQATLPLWLAFLLIRTLVNRPGKAERRTLSTIVAISLLGALQICLPTVIYGQLSEGGKGYRWTRVLYSPTGLGMEKKLLNTTSDAVAITTNIVRGLTCFTSNLGDTWGHLYCPNRTSGFLDPISGVLLWLGILFAIRDIKRKHNVDFNLLAISSFTLVWLALAFLFNGAPVYGRLMVALPFIYYFVVLAIENYAILLINSVNSKLVLQRAILFGITAAIAASNLYEVWISIVWASNEDTFSRFVRVVEEKKAVEAYTFYVISSPDEELVPDAPRRVLTIDIEHFAQPDQSVEWVALSPNQTIEQDLKGLPAAKCTIFLSQKAWNQVGASLKKRYPHLKRSQLIKDDDLIVFEVEVE